MTNVDRLKYKHAGIWFLFSHPVTSQVLHFRSPLGTFSSIVVILVLIALAIGAATGRVR
jgi:hypothetical protein